MDEINAAKQKGRNVPCGRCVECLSARRSSWSIRLNEELKNSSSGSFLTLTYNDENLHYLDLSENPEKWESFGEYVLHKPDLQKFFKRVRKFEPKVKYFAVGEYGSRSRRPHYHAIVFNCDNNLLLNKWNDGFARVDPCNASTIHYVTKYMLDEDRRKYPVPPFAIMSKGLGKSYIELAGRYYYNNKSTTYLAVGGQKNSLPRYYREKIFTKEQSGELGEQNRIRANEEREKLTNDEWRSRKDALELKAKKQSKSNKV